MMRKALMTVKSSSGRTWTEDFNADELPDRKVGQGVRSIPESICIHNQKDLETWGRNLIDWFNATRRPGEAERTFISIKFEEEERDG